MLNFIMQYITSVLGALAIMSITWLLIWKLFGKKLSRRKILLSKRAGWPQIKGEIQATLVSFLGGSAFMLVLVSFKDQGLTRFYVETGKYGILYEVATFLVMILVSDTWFYWLHRWMHLPAVYKYVHALHHKSLDVNPYTSTSFHLLESLSLTLWLLPLSMLMPISMTTLGIMQVIGNLNNLKSHLGYELFPGFFSKKPFNFFISATNHSIHHTQYNGNYGLFFRFWDVVCHTELHTTAATFDEIHQRGKVTVIDNTQYRELTIERIERETADTVSVYFKPTDAAFYQYTPGQHLTLRVPVSGKEYQRCFSLSSTPGIDDFLRITVKRKGAVSTYFQEQAKAGDRIRSLLPTGDFFYRKDPQAKQYVLIAGGSGITPLYSMLRSMLTENPATPVTLLYANTSRSSIIFKNALDQLVREHPQFRYQDFVSGEQRISAADLPKGEDIAYYICGPESLKKAITGYLKSNQVSEERIHIEQFADGYVPWFGLFR